MCEYCNENNIYKDGIGDWICYKDRKKTKWHLYAEMFKGEYSDFEVNYCPKCGRKLEVEEN